MVDIDLDDLVDKHWSSEEREEYLASLKDHALFDDMADQATIDAMHALIYEDETPESLTEHFKGKGNEMFKDAKRVHRRFYITALQYYLEALANAAKAEDTESMRQIRSSIHSNMAAVNLELKNWGTCLKDCEAALTLWPDNVKALFRCGKAALGLRRYERAVEAVSKAVELDGENKAAQQLLTKARTALSEFEQAQARRAAERNEREQGLRGFRSLLRSRGFRFGAPLFDRIKDFQLQAFVDESDGIMRWPVMLIYDQYRQSDFVQAFSEAHTMQDHLAVMFPENGPFLDWDARHEYVASNLVVYFQEHIVAPLANPATHDGPDEARWLRVLGADHVAAAAAADGAEGGASPAAEAQEQEEGEDGAAHSDPSAFADARWVHVPPTTTLGEVLAHPAFVISGCPVLHVFARSAALHGDFSRRTTAAHRLTELADATVGGRTQRVAEEVVVGGRLCDGPTCAEREDVEGGRVFSRCSRCETAVYCSRDCQKKHWKSHKASCTTKQ